MERMTMLLLLLSLLSAPLILKAQDTITSTLPMKDGDVLVSSGGSFEMGFFSPAISQKRYVGIWYKKTVPVPTVIWVANREAPLNNADGVMNVVPPGILVISDSTNATYWSSNASTAAVNPIAQLLDSGNLVVRDKSDGNPENFLWQGFDYPTDTLLPGMKIGKNFVTGLERYLTSWKSSDDPAPGNYTYHCDTSGYPQNILKEDQVEVFRTGLWNGIGFSGVPNLEVNDMFRFSLTRTSTEVGYGLVSLNSSIITKFTIDYTGGGFLSIWEDGTKKWIVYYELVQDYCDRYAICGPYSCCGIDLPHGCQCLDRFVPKYRREWSMADWSNGCVRRTRLNGDSDGFLRYSRVKLPDTRYSWFNMSMTLDECHAACLKDSSCMAYSNLDIRGAGSGCLLWFEEFIDMRSFPQGGQDIFIRMASSDLANHKNKDSIKWIAPLSVGAVLVGLILALLAWRKYSEMKRKGAQLGKDSDWDSANEAENKDLELPFFDLSTIAEATDNFSNDNKIGEGGFGPVYKGVLEEGQVIAVKRLSKDSHQGLDNFKNEVICISKLQHRNLVKLRGCCIQRDERMLVYEYMPNKSLDYFIFDHERRASLDWPQRCGIINGVARGLLYLHQDSRLRVIHRDVKASNILLDLDMNPKISDFGIAKSFGGNETEANTERVMGTRGYMSPEYAAEGIFSVKSDVFSFGVLMLEVLSGKRNRGFSRPGEQHNLLGHAWQLYREGRSSEFIDATIGDPCYFPEVSRSIHVALLCVQQYPEDRPSMSRVVTMLTSEVELPQPKVPGFYTERTVTLQRNVLEAQLFSSSQVPSSPNKITITVLEPR